MNLWKLAVSIDMKPVKNPLLFGSMQSKYSNILTQIPNSPNEDGRVSLCIVDSIGMLARV